MSLSLSLSLSLCLSEPEQNCGSASASQFSLSKERKSCGHFCYPGKLQKCCACEDIRPVPSPHKLSVNIYVNMYTYTRCTSLWMYHSYVIVVLSRCFPRGPTPCTLTAVGMSTRAIATTVCPLFGFLVLCSSCPLPSSGWVQRIPAPPPRPPALPPSRCSSQVATVLLVVMLPRPLPHMQRQEL